TSRFSRASSKSAGRLEQSPTPTVIPRSCSSSFQGQSSSSSQASCSTSSRATALTIAVRLLIAFRTQARTSQRSCGSSVRPATRGRRRSTMDEHDRAEQRLSREQLLKLAAAAGGAGLLGGRIGTAQAALDWLNAESGRLQVLDWAGYGNDGGQTMFAQYVKQYPHNAPQFTYMGNEADALAKIHAGLKPDLFRPYVGWVKYFATSGLVQPWGPKRISNFKNLNPFMAKAGQYQGKQYGIPDDWGFDAILYRSDKVKPKAKSWGLLFDDRYAGHIAWFDDIEMFEIAGLYLGFP